ncbi:hypothetical protein [Methanobacterium sp. BAmetb5]|uniref:hypothetical protein n=1 Tax=Methanobacterium sp. BAmetb5 TaxID=2025351 RepID=UPI000E9F7F36|nr:hypothetical protein [Methanobacterium sp. BAmetb5]AXV40319.1 MAG: hypothetical protein CIT02_08295 [Methanobacterium sp. BAmetb5]
MYLDLFPLTYLENVLSGGLASLGIIFPSSINTSHLLASTMNALLALAIFNIYSHPQEEESLFKTAMKVFALLFMIQNLLFALYFLLNPPDILHTPVTPLVFLAFEFILLALVLKSALKERLQT